MNDEARLMEAQARLAQAADLIQTASKLVTNGTYTNCKQGTYRRQLLSQMATVGPQMAQAVNSLANSMEYVAKRLDRPASA